MILIYKRKGRRGAYDSRKQNRLFLKLSEKIFIRPGPPLDGRAFCCPHDAYGQVEK
jgi:hypothetical protein